MKNKTEGKGKLFACLLGLQALIMTAACYFCRVRFEVSDDFVMELILEGAFDGTRDPYLMFTSVLWGRVLIWLESLVPGLSFYTLSQLLTVLLTLACICALLSEERWPWALLFLAIVNLYLGQDLYLLLQFTKIAAGAIGAGGFLFLRNLFHERRPGAAVLGALTLVLGCLWRHNALMIAGGYLFFYLVLELVLFMGRKEEGQKKQRMQTLALEILLPILLMAGIIGGLRLANNLAYEKDPGYRYYMDYSNLRSAIVDGEMPDYEACREEFEEAGITETTWTMIRRWCFADRAYFSPERMEKAGQIVEAWRAKNRSDPETLKSRLEERERGSYPAMTAIVLLIFLGILISPWTIPAAIFGRALTFGLSMILLSRGHLVYRVEYGLMLSEALLYLFVMRLGGWGFVKKEEPLSQSLSPFLQGGLVLLTCLLTAVRLPACLPDRSWEKLSLQDYRTRMYETFEDSWSFGAEKYSAMAGLRTMRPAFLEYIRSHPENLYLMDFSTTIQNYYFDFPPMEPLSPGFFGNTLYLGGVTVNHPAIDRALARWGLQEPLPGLLKDHVYLVTNRNQDLVLAYLRTFYAPDTCMEKVGEYDGYWIWSYTRPSGEGD